MNCKGKNRILASLFCLAALAPGTAAELKATYESKAYWNGVSGNTAQSFLTPGWETLDNLFLTYNSRLHNDEWRFQTVFNSRITSDPLVDWNQGRVLRWYSQLSKDNDWNVRLGQQNVDYSRYTMSYYLQSAGVNKTLPLGFNVDMMAGRMHPDSQRGEVWRDVWGGRLKKSFKDDLLVIGMSGYRSKDENSSIPPGFAYTPLDNTVFGADVRLNGWDVGPFQAITLDAEYALSRTDTNTRDTSAVRAKDHTWRAEGSFGIRKSYFEGGYEMTRPDFVTNFGSASADQTTWRAAWRQIVTDRISTRLGYDATRDNVRNTAAATDKAHNVRMLLALLPYFEDRRLGVNIIYDRNYALTTGGTRDNLRSVVGGDASYNGKHYSLTAGINQEQYGDRLNGANNQRLLTGQAGLRVRDLKPLAGRPLVCNLNVNYYRQNARYKSTGYTDYYRTYGAGFDARFRDDWTASVSYRANLTNRYTNFADARTYSWNGELGWTPPKYEHVNFKLGYRRDKNAYEDATLNYTEQVVEGSFNARF